MDPQNTENTFHSGQDRFPSEWSQQLAGLWAMVPHLLSLSLNQQNANYIQDLAQSEGMPLEDWLSGVHGRVSEEMTMPAFTKGGIDLDADWLTLKRLDDRASMDNGPWLWQDRLDPRDVSGVNLRVDHVEWLRNP
jgi:hypothetical protein